MLRRFLAAIAVLTLLAACSGDDDGSARDDRQNDDDRSDQTDDRSDDSGSDDSGSDDSGSDDSGSDDSGSDDDGDVTTADPDAVAAGVPDGAAVTCPPATVTVETSDELTDALADAEPGDSIALSAGTYEGRFIADAEASPDAPIFLCGPQDAVVDGGGIRGGYALHLDGASGWRVVGFTVRNAQKGVVVDRGVGNVIQGLRVEEIGDEAIHLRTHSTDNVVRDNVIRGTGLRRDRFGEGVYIGSADSNWCRYTDCDPDRSDRNLVEGNDIADTGAEAVDIKEGTTGGVVRDNTFDGDGMTGGDSWVDVKGNGWLIEGNAGTRAPLDGFQVHEIREGWGEGNVFRANVADVGADGFGFATTNARDNGNVVSCGNDVVAAGEGFSDVDCTP